MQQQQQQRKDPKSPKDADCKDCIDKDNPTQKDITTERKKVCDILYYTSAETLSTQEERFGEENKLYHQKKCLFVNTEDNYRRYRNLDITVVTELVQSNISVKNNVAAFNKWNKDLNTALNNIAKGIKDSKTKFKELQKAADDLKNCLGDSCNKAQKKALTGKAEDCKDESTPPEPCKYAGDILDELTCIPGGLTKDIDSIFKASYDVVGIQIFSNIETLAPLQLDLETFSNDFKTHVQAVAKLRKTDMDTQQGSLVTSVQDITKAAMERNDARSNFEGYYDAVKFLCCPACDCVIENENDRDCEKGCEPRLKECEKEICGICDDVKQTFCCDPVERKEDEDSYAD